TLTPRFNVCDRTAAIAFAATLPRTLSHRAGTPLQGNFPLRRSLPRVMDTACDTGPGSRLPRLRWELPPLSAAITPGYTGLEVAVANIANRSRDGPSCQRSAVATRPVARKGPWGDGVVRGEPGGTRLGGLTAGQPIQSCPQIRFAQRGD